MVKSLLSLLLFVSIANAQSLPTDVCNSLKEERAKYPSNFSDVCSQSGDEKCPLGYILNTVAWQYRTDRWVLSSKTSGYYVYSPAGSIASDILQQDGQMWDVFLNAGTTSDVVCDQFLGAASRPPVNPVDPNVEPPPDCSELEKENKLLKVQINNLTVDLNQCKDLLSQCQSTDCPAKLGECQGKLGECQARLEAVTCTCSAKLFGFIKVPCDCKVVK